eukprot:753461-Hanusia_phi.AAC.5
MLPSLRGSRRQGFALGAVGLLAFLSVCGSDMNTWGKGGSFDCTDKSRLRSLLPARIRGGEDCEMACDECQAGSEVRAIDNAFSCNKYCLKGMVMTPRSQQRSCNLGSEVTSQESYLAEGKPMQPGESAERDVAGLQEDASQSPGSVRSRYPNRRSPTRSHPGPLSGVYLPKVLGESRSVSDLSRGSSPYFANNDETRITHGLAETARFHRPDVAQLNACTVFANDVVKIKLVGSVHDIDMEQKSFSPLFTHQVVIAPFHPLSLPFNTYHSLSLLTSHSLLPSLPRFIGLSVYLSLFFILSSLYAIPLYLIQLQLSRFLDKERKSLGTSIQKWKFSMLQTVCDH